MAFYIWLDKDGKEIERKEKTRGRPPLGAVPNEDGNSYISLDENNVPKNNSAPKKEKLTKVIIDVDTSKEEDEVEEVEEEIEEIDTENGQVKHRKSKKHPGYTEIEYDDTPVEVAVEEMRCLKETKKIHMKDFLKCCFVDPKDFIVTDKTITLARVIIVGETELLNIRFNSAYSRIEIDIENNVTRVWTISPKNPTFYIQNLFLDFDTENVR